MPHVELPQTELKVVVIGDTSVGKTSLILRFVEGYYRNEHTSSSGSSPPQPRSPTLHASYYSKNILLPTTHVTTKIQIWDTAGQEPFRKMTPMYYKTAAAVMVCFDKRSPRSFTVAQELVDQVYSLRPVGDIFVALVATKSDLQYANDGSHSTKTMVSDVEARQYAHSIGAMYIDTSAKQNENVTFVFSKVAEGVLAQREAARLNASIESSGAGNAGGGGGDIRKGSGGTTRETNVNGIANGGAVVNSGGGLTNPDDDSLDNIKLDNAHGEHDPLNDPSLTTGFCMGPFMECSSTDSTSSSCVIT